MFKKDLAKISLSQEVRFRANKGKVDTKTGCTLRYCLCNHFQTKERFVYILVF